MVVVLGGGDWFWLTTHLIRMVWVTTHLGCHHFSLLWWSCSPCSLGGWQSTVTVLELACRCQRGSLGLTPSPTTIHQVAGMTTSSTVRMRTTPPATRCFPGEKTSISLTTLANHLEDFTASLFCRASCCEWPFSSLAVSGFSDLGLVHRPAAAVNNDDYPLMQGVFLIITLAVLLANIVADVFYVLLDPRTGQGA